MQYVVIGGSIASASAIAAMKRKDPDAEITVVAPETLFYFRPLIPMLLDGSRSMEDISYSNEVEGIARVVKDRATGLDIESREVSLGSGERITYDRLLIATGSAAVIPDIPGADALHTLRTSEDALALSKAASRAKKAMVVGGGLVGIKTALALGAMGLRVTIVEQLEQLLHPRLDERGASIIEERLRSRGIEIITNETVSEISKGKAKLEGGCEVDAQLAVAAIGTAPGVGWLKGSNLEIEGGLSVDGKLMTSASGVYAAGDAASFDDVVTGRRVNSALWTNAVEMGRVAGTNMAGGNLTCPGIWQVLNATEIEGVPMVSAGKTEADSDEDVFSHNGPGGYRKFVFDGARLKGFLFMGDIKGAGIYKSLIGNRTELTETQKQKAVNYTLGYADFAAAGAEN